MQRQESSRETLAAFACAGGTTLVTQAVIGLISNRRCKRKVLASSQSQFDARSARSRPRESRSEKQTHLRSFLVVFADLEEWRANALLVHPALPQKSIAALALKHRLPAVSPTSIFCQAGGLASYSADIKVLAAQCGAFVDKILKGRRPFELPAELPTGFRLMVKPPDGQSNRLGNSADTARARRRRDRMIAMPRIGPSRHIAMPASLVANGA